jgi:hypothetical protein
MPYYSGTAASSSALQTIIETEAVANGWTLTSGTLYKGGSAVKLSNTTNQLIINAFNDPDGVTGPADDPRSIYIDTGYWPITYYLFIWDTPDVIVCVVNYGAFKIQVLMFGDIVKTHSSAYVGGNFYFATRKADATGEDASRVQLSQHQLLTSGDTGFGNDRTMVIPFTERGYTSSPPPHVKNIHVEIDGTTWADTSDITFTDTTLNAYYRSPNTWNQQAHLVPMNLQFAMNSSLYNPIGYVEHVRLVRVDNYNIGDIITIAPDEWKVFPWTQKDTVLRNGSVAGGTDGYSGTLGFAVRYDGP